MTKVAESIADALDNYEKQIDAKLGEQVKHVALMNPICINAPTIPNNVVQALWPRYAAAGWDRVDRSGDYLRFYYPENLIKKIGKNDNQSDSAGPLKKYMQEIERPVKVD